MCLYSPPADTTIEVRKFSESASGADTVFTDYIF
jgi:hypothetical protein